jgi:hypothetical protein
MTLQSRGFFALEVIEFRVLAHGASQNIDSRFPVLSPSSISSQYENRVVGIFAATAIIDKYLKHYPTHLILLG